MWEGARTNTPARGIKTASGHGIKIPVGFDARVDGDPVSLYMRQYGTGGTPWTTVIDKKGIVRINAFTPRDLDALIGKIMEMRKEE